MDSPAPKADRLLHRCFCRVLPDRTWVEYWKVSFKLMQRHTFARTLIILVLLDLGSAGFSVANLSVFCYLKCWAYQPVCCLSRCPTREPVPASLSGNSCLPLPALALLTGPGMHDSGFSSAHLPPRWEVGWRWSTKPNPWETITGAVRNKRMERKSKRAIAKVSYSFSVVETVLIKACAGSCRCICFRGQTFLFFSMIYYSW